MPEDEPDPETVESESVTDDAATRWAYLSTTVSLLVISVVLMVYVAVSLGYAEWPGGNAGGAVGLVFLLMAVYVVGDKAVAAYKELKG